MADEQLQYPDQLVNRLEILWGEGFLSPGGPDEVYAIVDGIDLSGKGVLDIGCGTGGVELVLARDLDAARVTAIDVEGPLLERARRLLGNSEVADKVEFHLVEPGPLDWPDSSFDVVFSKDSLIHIGDKAEMYHEILRVLRPGGVFVASDWLGGENTDTSPEWQRVRELELGHLDFTMVTAAQTEQMLQTVGFVDVSTIDRNAWYADVIREEIRSLEGPLRGRLLEVVSEDIYLRWLKFRRALRDSVDAGAMRPTHIRGHKPW